MFLTLTSRRRPHLDALMTRAIVAAMASSNASSAILIEKRRDGTDHHKVSFVILGLAELTTRGDSYVVSPQQVAGTINLLRATQGGNGAIPTFLIDQSTNAVSAFKL